MSIRASSILLLALLAFTEAPVPAWANGANAVCLLFRGGEDLPFPTYCFVGDSRAGAWELPAAPYYTEEQSFRVITDAIAADAKTGIHHSSNEAISGYYAAAYHDGVREDVSLGKAGFDKMVRAISAVLHHDPTVLGALAEMADIEGRLTRPR